MEKPSISLNAQDGALVRKLVASGMSITRARQLEDMVIGMRTTMMDNPFIRSLSSPDLMPIFALLLGDMMAINTGIINRLDLESREAWIENADVMHLLEIAQWQDPNPPAMPANVRTILDSIGYSAAERNDTEMLEDAAADMAEAAGQPVQRMGKA